MKSWRSPQPLHSNHNQLVQAEIKETVDELKKLLVIQKTAIGKERVQ